MKHGENEKYFKFGLMLIGVMIVGLLCSFVLDNFSKISDFLDTVLSILMPFIYGGVIAYLLAPLCNKLEKILGKFMPNKKGLAKGISILIALLVMILVIVLLLVLVIPNLVESIVGIIQSLPSQMENLVSEISDLLESKPTIQAYVQSFINEATDMMNDWLGTDLLSLIQSFLTNFSTQFLNIFNLVKNVFMGTLISVYLLSSRKKFAIQAVMLLYSIFPEKWAKIIEEEVHYADRMFNGFLVGKIIDSTIIGLICFAFTTILSFDSAVLISVIIGVTNIVPFFGPWIGAIPCVIILLLENPVHCLIFIIFILVLQQIDGNFIGPKVLGETTGVSSFWVLFSVFLFGGLWGFVGMIIGVPLFAVIYDIVKRLVYYGLKKHKREDLILEQDQPTEETP